MIWNVLVLILIGYAAICLLMFIFQRKLLYLPMGSQLSEQQASTEGLRHWPSFDNFRGYIDQTEPANANGAVIVFHGNAGAAYHRSFYVRALSIHNLRVILAEYPGYGGRPGSPSEKALVQDALETIRLAHQAYGEPLYLWGESLGGGVVSGAVSKTNVPVKGLVMFTPWDTLPNVAQTHYRYLPARWLVLDQYNNVDNLKSFEGDIAVVLAGNDEVVPVQHGQRLYESITANKKLWVFEGARHNEMPVSAGLPWWEEVIAFISQPNAGD